MRHPNTLRDFHIKTQEVLQMIYEVSPKQLLKAKRDLSPLGYGH